MSFAPEHHDLSRIWWGEPPSDYGVPPAIVGAEGCYLIDVLGRRFLDAAGGLSVGHRNPMILNAVVDQIWKLQQLPAGCTAEPGHQLARVLIERAPKGLTRCLLVGSRSDALAAARHLASTATRRGEFIFLDEPDAPPWHRLPLGTIDLEQTHFVPPPRCGRCPLGRTWPECGLACADLVGEAVDRLGADRVAALVSEPIPVGPGVVVPPDGYWPRVREACAQRGVLLVLDESRTGLNRTGPWWAAEHCNLVPDVLVIGGSLGGGLPLAAVLTGDRLADALDQPLPALPAAIPAASAAGVATARFHQTAALGDRSRRHGAAILSGLREICERSPGLRHARGLGLLLAVDCVDEAGRPDPRRCARCLRQMRDWGFLFGRGGRDGEVVTIAPPLTLTEEQADTIVNAFAEWAAAPE